MFIIKLFFYYLSFSLIFTYHLRFAILIDKKTLLLFFLLFFSILSYTQINLLNGIPVDFDKCGFDTDKRSEFIQILGDH